jgi:TP901 family phage tail tape measure protein
MGLGGLAQAFVRLRIDSSLVAADTTKGIEEGAGAADVESAGANAGERFSSGFNKAFKVAMVGALVVAAIGAASVKMGVNFQDAMTKVQTQAGASKAQVKQLSAEVLNLAPSTEQGPQKLALALYHLTSVGMSPVAAMVALKQASDLAAVGGSNLEDTTNALAGAWKSGISGAQNFGLAAATLNAIVGAGNMTMSELVAGMGSGVMAAADTFGLSLKQVGAAEALMADSGIPARVAATDLKTSISLLGAPSATAAKQLAAVGLSSTQLATAMRSGGLIGAISLLKEHIKGAGLNAVQTSQLLSRAFGGGKTGASIMLLYNRLDALKQKQDQINAGVSKFGSDVTTQRQTAAAQFALLRSAVETVGVRIGLALLPPLTRFVHFLASDVIPAAVKIGGILGKAFKNPYILAFVGGLVAAVVAIKAVITAIKIWTTVQELLDIALVDNPIGITIVAVAALAAGIAILWERSSTFRKVVEGAFRGVLSVVKTVWDWIKGHWKLLAAILLAPFAPLIAAGYALYKLVGIVVHVFDSIKKAITRGFDGWWKSHGKEIEQVWHAAWGAIKAVFKALWDPTIAVIKGAWKALIDVFKVEMKIVATIWRIGWGALSAVVRAVWDVISGVVKVAWAIISGVISIGIAGIKSVIKIAWDVIVGIFTVALDLLTGHWGKAWDDIKKTVTQVWNAIKGFLATAWKDIKHTATAAWNALYNGVVSMGKDLLGYFKRLPGEILSALGDVGHLLWSAGKAILDGLLGGLKSAWNTVSGWVGNVAGWISNLKGPLEKDKVLLVPHGQAIMDGLLKGMKSRVGQLKTFLGGIAHTITALAKEPIPKIKSQLTTAKNDETAGTKQLNQATAIVNKLKGERAKEENQIKKLIAERVAEYKKEGAASKAVRAEQEKQIKSLEKLRSAQESQVKKVDASLKPLRSELSKLKTEVGKLTKALAKATTAAAKAAAKASSSSSSSSGSSSSSTSSTAAAGPDWAGFGQWLNETSGVTAAGGWQENPGPLGGFGNGLAAGPGVSGRFGGMPHGSGQDAVITALNMQTGRLDDLIEIGREQPGRTAAGLNAAMNGVVSHAMVKGNW